MNGDIRPPRQVTVPARSAGPPPVSVSPELQPLVSTQPPTSMPPETGSTPDQASPPSAGSSSPPPEPSKKRPKRSRRFTVLAMVLLSVSAIVIVGYIMLMYLTGPFKSHDTAKQSLTIATGSSAAQIGDLLQQKGLIRSALGFDLYTRIHGSRSQLKAGTYRLSASQSVGDIVKHITAGKSDQFEVTFLPGATLAENRKALIESGYSAAEVDAALQKTYTHALFRDKPASADLEGYIYGETYKFNVDATVDQILTSTFDEFYAEIKEQDLINKFAQHGLTLYQGITLASIIQREVPSATDQKQVAQVFYSRLAAGMTLGSDVTFQYAAKKLGVQAVPTLDSPYNTRKYAGLTPGPIAVPGRTALEAVASPAAGDYLYFLSGDDNVTYFAHTEAEHTQNIHDHCQVKCS